MTTRAVAELAEVQAPAIYRLFGDKDGLLEAVAEHVMTGFVVDKAAGIAAAVAEDADPLDDLRQSWRQQIEFGLANPAVFRLLSDPDRALRSPAAQAGREILASRVSRLAVAGRLRVPERRAVSLIHAAGMGSIQSLLATPVEERDPALGDAMLDAVLGRILTKGPADAPVDAAERLLAAAVSLRALASHLHPLTVCERQLLAEWLDRITYVSD